VAVNPLGHMQACTSLQTDNHASTPPLSVLQAGCPYCRQTNSVKALKAMALKAISSNIVVKYGVAFGGRTVSLTKLAYLITAAFIGQDGRSADSAALCCCHSFSRVPFEGCIVSRYFV